LSIEDAHRCRNRSLHEAAAITLYAASGRLIPFNSNSPTGSTFTAFSTFVHPRTDENSTRLGFVAKARGDIGYCADGGIVEASFKADGAERSEAVRDADAKANVMAKGQFSINHA
jgi:hypothetical protein